MKMTMKMTKKMELVKILIDQMSDEIVKPREFIDARAEVGRPRRAPISEIAIHANSTSRSLNAASHDHGLDRFIQCKIRPDGYLQLDFKKVISDGKIRIAKTYAVKLAEWILKEYSDDAAANPPETNVVRKSKGNRRISPKPAKTDEEVES